MFGLTLKNLFNFRNAKVLNILSARFCKISEYSDPQIEEILNADSEYNEIVDQCLKPIEPHNCLIIQPYVKWGPKKLEITPEEQLDEAVALIKTLPKWTVENTINVPLDSLDRKTLFKSGSMEKLASMIKSDGNISAAFINLGNLTTAQTMAVQGQFGVPILDRYRIVMQILKIHASSQHAKLQVALAELYFVERKSQKGLFFANYNKETMRMMFKNREQKLKAAINNVRQQRSLLRNKRKKLDFPVIAVVGYTNSGKTSLIKALTGEEKLMPRNQLFATLDVTLHSGFLPSKLNVLYVDTVGFISDIPTNLIECFVATLEDAVLADVILHVEDLASSCFHYKRKHVMKILKQLADSVQNVNVLDKIIHVGNKSDLVGNVEEFDVFPVSAKKGTNLEELKHRLEQMVLENTERRKMTIKVRNGGEELRWLYKNSTIVTVNSDNDAELLQANVIITKAKLEQFKYKFIVN